MPLPRVHSFTRSNSVRICPGIAGFSGKIEQIWSTPGDYRYPRLSGDGKRIAIELRREGRPGIWVYDIARQTMGPLSPDGETGILPVWSPDGQYVVFSIGNTLAWVRPMEAERSSV